MLEDVGDRAFELGLPVDEVRMIWLDIPRERGDRRIPALVASTAMMGDDDAYFAAVLEAIVLMGLAIGLCEPPITEDGMHSIVASKRYFGRTCLGAEPVVEGEDGRLGLRFRAVRPEELERRAVGKVRSLSAFEALWAMRLAYAAVKVLWPGS